MGSGMGARVIGLERVDEFLAKNARKAAKVVGLNAEFERGSINDRREGRWSKAHQKPHSIQAPSLRMRSSSWSVSSSRSSSDLRPRRFRLLLPFLALNLRTRSTAGPLLQRVHVCVTRRA